jgi:peptidyl-prolyl cis-trans isomerase SurA
MKKGFVTVLVLLAAMVFAAPVFSDSVSTPIVRVNLTKTTVITQQQLDEAVVAYNEAYSTTFDEATVLDALISDELFKQALERDGYTLTEEQQDQLLASQKSSIESQYGASLTDEEFEALLETQGYTTDTYKTYLTNQYLLQSYVYAMKGDMIESAAEPTTSEIESFYKKNKSSFISDENVKLAHIYFEFGDTDETKAAALEKATEVSNLIASGKITFEKAVVEYSEDSSSKDSGGEIGWLQISDTDTMSYMGENFFDQVFALSAGEVSGVIESLAGYHIVKVSVHNDTKILGLDDKIYPTDTTTVRDYIYSYLYSQNVNTAFQEAYLSLIADLKADASIKYLK